MADQTLEADRWLGRICATFQSLNKHYVDLLNFPEMLSVSSLHVQQGRIVLSTHSGVSPLDLPHPSWCLAQLTLRELLSVGSSQFFQPLPCSKSTKVIKLPNFTVAHFLRVHLQAHMGKPAVHFSGVMAYIKQLLSLFSVFKHVEIACEPQSSWGIRALCAQSKPSQSMSSPQRRRKKVPFWGLSASLTSPSH